MTWRGLGATGARNTIAVYNEPRIWLMDGFDRNVYIGSLSVEINGLGCVAA